ncbi:DUF6069 family protein [Micromonospora sp. NPDC048842]|uniref:DUF6069 family protein n=1 Tax=unclassified Micromonospora TaxID=2617518 RepID=UPI0033CBA7F8
MARVTGPAAGRPSHTHRFRGLAGTGLTATLVAVVSTTLAAALARAAGIDFEIPDGGETIPLSGFAVVTGFFSVVGVVIALLGLHLVAAAVMIPVLARSLSARTD